MQFAELLNDAGRSIRIAQPPPADSANTLWIGYVAIRNRILFMPTYTEITAFFNSSDASVTLRESL